MDYMDIWDSHILTFYLKKATSLDKIFIYMMDTFLDKFAISLVSNKKKDIDSQGT